MERQARVSHCGSPLKSKSFFPPLLPPSLPVFPSLPLLFLACFSGRISQIPGQPHTGYVAKVTLNFCFFCFHPSCAGRTDSHPLLIFCGSRGGTHSFQHAGQAPEPHRVVLEEQSWDQSHAEFQSWQFIMYLPKHLQPKILISNHNPQKKLYSP